MKIPHIDLRNRNDIIKKIKELSSSFTPEWNFDESNPDIAAAAALIYADMTKTTIDKYNLTCEKNMIEFFARTGAEPLCSSPAEGFVTFVVAGNEQNVIGEYIEKDTAVSSDENGSHVIFTTQESLYAVNTTLKKVIYTDGEKDVISCLYENDQKKDFYEFSLVTDDCDNLQKHILIFPCEILEHTSYETVVMIRFGFDGADADLKAKFLKAVSESGISYFAADGEKECQNLKETPDGVEFTLEFEPIKTVLYDRENYWLKICFENIKGITDVYLNSISCKTRDKQVVPDSILNENGQLTVSRFEPFGFGLMLYSSVYFASDLVLSKRTSRITLQFSVKYKKVPIVESIDDNIEWKYIMKKSSLKKPKEYDVSIRQVVWEYFNGSGWVRLFKDDSYEDVFNGKNDNKTVKVTFECPHDIRPVFLPTGEGYAIRARIAGVENYMKSYGYYIMPEVFMKGISYEYTSWTDCKYAAAENNLEKVFFSFNGLSFNCIKGLEHKEKIIEFCFSAPLDLSGIRLLLAPDRQTSAYEKNETGCLWEYMTNEGYKVLSAADGSHGLSKAGLLNLDLNKGFSDRQIMGERFYRVRVRFVKRDRFPVCRTLAVYPNTTAAKNTIKSGDEYFHVSKEDSLDCRLSQNGLYSLNVSVNEISAVSQVKAEEMISKGFATGEYSDDGILTKLWIEWDEYDPVKSHDGRYYVADRDTSVVTFGISGGAIPPDSTEANVKISYLTCQGKNGNIPPMTPLNAVSSGGLIAGIFSPLGMSGGKDREGLEKTIKRSGAKLRMCGKVRTTADYENYIMGTWCDVVRVKCFSSRDGNGNNLPGSIAIVILLRNMENFDSCRDELIKGLKRISPSNINGIHPHIIRPTNVLYSIKAELVCESFDSAGSVKQRAVELIREYFDIEKGNINHSGWKIGELPEKMTLYTLLASMPEVISINEFSFLEASEEGVYITDRELEEILKKGMCIPVADNIEINVKIDI